MIRFIPNDDGTAIPMQARPNPSRIPSEPPVAPACVTTSIPTAETAQPPAIA